MLKKLMCLLLCAVITVSLAACNEKKPVGQSPSPEPTVQTNQPVYSYTPEQRRDIVYTNDIANEERIRLLKEDAEYFASEFPKWHINAFTVITREEFDKKCAALIENTPNLTNEQFFVEMRKIVAAVGDAHSSSQLYIWDKTVYPLDFWIFDGEVYITNAARNLSDMLYTKVLKINGVDIEEVTERLAEIIPHENEYWLNHELASTYLKGPLYLQMLGIIPDTISTIFTVEKDGEAVDFKVVTAWLESSVNYKLSRNILTGWFAKYYDYKYMPDDKTIYFQYNSCYDMLIQKFNEFSAEMFDTIENEEVERIIIDLRANTGGNTKILSPFTDKLRSYILSNREVKVYVLIGRNTMSAGAQAINDITESAKNVVLIGEPTGGALDYYGNPGSFYLPNSQFEINISKDFYELSKRFNLIRGAETERTDTFLPDVFIEMTLEDFINGYDAVLDYALHN